MRPAIAALLLVLTLFVAVVAETSEALPRGVRRNLEKTALELAKVGRVDELRTVLEVLETLGGPEGDLRGFGAKQVAAAAKVSRPGKTTSAVKALDRALESLAAWLESLEGERRRSVAKAIIALNDQHEAASRILGRAQIDGRWVDGDRAKTLERRSAIARLLTETRHLPVPVKVEPSRHPVLLGTVGEGHVRVTHGTYTLHTDLPPAKAERILRETVRAVALGNRLLGGELALPAGSWTMVRFEKKTDYLRSLDWAVRQKWLKPEKAEHSRKTSNWYSPEGDMVAYIVCESYTEVGDMYHTLWTGPLRGAQPVLRVGLCNWIGLAYLGRPLPGVNWFERKGGGGVAGGRTTARRGRTSAAELEILRRLGDAGIAGCKAWMAWLARRDEDPPWSAGFLEQDGMIKSEDRVKATIVAEYLCERALLVPLVAGTRPATGGPGERVPVFEKVLGEPLSEFERGWRRWLLPELDGGLRQRLGVEAPGTAALSAEDRSVLDHLNRVRAVAFGRPLSAEGYVAVTMEPSLSEGCRLHCRYLARYPEQATEWPGAHEEYPDREGFTPEGCRAAGASVIAPGAAGPVEAIDAWMGTFFHRLPLLDTGLLRIGWGLEGGYACLDAHSMVGITSAPQSTVCWPADRQTGVPLAFQPEIPNPVPGQDQGAWGYPITLQLFSLPRDASQSVLEMTLTDSGGSVVDCWFTGPEQPLNPELSPEAAWCLIPKARLKPGTRYQVQARLADRSVSWSFVTGR